MEVQDFVPRILAALALGLVIGLERQLGQHPDSLVATLRAALLNRLASFASDLLCASTDGG